MSTLGDSFPPEQKKKYINSKLKSGKILRIFCPFTDPPKEKYVVLAYYSSKSRSLGFVINSNIRDFIKKKDLLDYQVKINPSDYSFLEHNSYIDCVNVKYFDKTLIENQLLSEIDRIKGELTPDKRNEIIKVVDKAKTISKRHKELIINALDY